jgi:hypothetical protein
MTSRTFYRRLSLVVWLAGFMVMPLSTFAQSDARFAGYVRDTQGGAVANAQVSMKNERTAEERKTTSNSQGYVFVGGLKPSTYTIKVEMPSFAPIEYPGMTLAVGQQLTLDFELKPAGLQEAVNVVATAPLLNVSSADMGVNVSEREVEGLPINGRQMSQLMLQSPGSTNSGAGTWYDVRFSGRSVEQNAYRYDGIDGGAIISSVPGNINGELMTPFKLQASLENVQEFRVESSAYPAEFGTGSAGQISVVTKSGGNNAHGAVFEYLRNDKFDAPNYFDTTANLPKSKLRQNQFGGSIGGPIARDRAFFFGSYEGYRQTAGINIVEAVPSAAAWARAVPSIAALRPGFLSPAAIILPGVSKDPNFDIAQLQTPNIVREDSFSGRFDLKLNDRWSVFVRGFHDQGRTDQPDNVAGRVVRITDRPTNGVFNLQGILSSTTSNELKIGYNAAPSTLVGLAPTVNGIDFSPIFISLTGSVANTGLPGQGPNSGITSPGGLVRSNSAQNGRAQPYTPYALSFIDSISSVHGNHFLKVGGEYRMLRMTTDRLGGTTYSFSNVDLFLANQPATVQYLGDESAPSVFNNGATGLRHLQEWYGIGYAQDEWRVNPQFTVNAGLRYDYYSLVKEAHNLAVKFNTDTGQIDPPTTPAYHPLKTNIQPRLGTTFTLDNHTVVRGGFGLFTGPGIFEGLIQPQADSDRVSVTFSGAPVPQFPLDPNLAVSTFVNTPNNRQYQPRAFRNDYKVPEHIWSYTGSIQRDLGMNTAVTAAYIGSIGHNLFIRSIANTITQVVTNPDPTKAAIVVRQFSIVQRDAAGNITGVQNPFAEIDTKTSGGHDKYNALQLGLSRRSAGGLALNAQYTLARSFGTSPGSKEAQTAANNAQKLSDWEYDLGYNPFDIRHSYNFSALYEIPYAGRGGARALLGGWNIGGIFNGRTGIPIQVNITRPDVLYVDAAGNYFQNPAGDRVAVINTPLGGATRNVRRPDLVPGVNPFVTNGGLVFLNPAAFATPSPGTFGNLQRGKLHGPNFAQLDLVIAKKFDLGGSSKLEFRTEVFNVLNQTNFSNPVAGLPNALPSNALTEANKVQPGQPFTAAAAGAFGKLTSTVSRTVGLGTNRQVQFALRLDF